MLTRQGTEDRDIGCRPGSAEKVNHNHSAYPDLENQHREQRLIQLQQSKRLSLGLSANHITPLGGRSAQFKQ